MKQNNKMLSLSLIFIVFLMMGLNLEDHNPIVVESTVNLPVESGPGIYQTENFIPNGTDASRFSSSSWKYSPGSSYSDSFWGAPQLTSVTQNWNPENVFFSNIPSIQSESTDFQSLGVGSMNFNPARRSRDFRLSDSDVNFTFDDAAGKPAQVANLPSGNSFESKYEYYSSKKWSTAFTNTYYPGNQEYDYLTRYYKTGNTAYVPSQALYNNYQAGGWTEGNTLNALSRTNTTVNPNTQSYSVTHARNAWYNYYFDYSGTNSERVTVSWDVTSSYTSEFRLSFYYSESSNQTHAYYGSNIVFNPYNLKTNPETGSSYWNFDVDGSITYEVWQASPTPTNITQAFQRNLFNDNNLGAIPVNSSVSKSLDFGSALNQTGWYYLRIIVATNLRAWGSSYSEGNIPNLYMAPELGGIDVTVSSPYVQVFESTPIKTSTDKEILIETKDAIEWGETRTVLSGSDANLTFGYRVPDTLVGADGVAQTLDKIRIVAILSIQNNSVTKNYTEYGKTLDQVRNQPSIWGTGCDKFIWELNDTVIANLNNSYRFKMYIGVIVSPNLELDYYTNDFSSRIYFNNISFWLNTEVKITGRFQVQTPNGLAEQNYNFSIFNNEEFFTKEVSTGDAVFGKLFNGTWTILINKTTSQGLVYVIYNSTFLLDTNLTSFTFIIKANLTNVNFAVKNQFGDLITTGNPRIVMKNLANGDTRVIFASAGYALVSEVYDGTWRVYVNVTIGSHDYTIFNESKTIVMKDYPWPDQYFITIGTFANLTASLTNFELKFVDPLGQNMQNALVTLQSQSLPQNIQSAYSDTDGNVTFHEILDGLYTLSVKSQNHVVFNITYNLQTMNDVVYSAYVCNLTNIMLQIQDYSGNAISNSLTPFVQLKHTSSLLKSGYTSNGNISFTEIYNSTVENSWQLTVNVTTDGRNYTVFNSSLPIYTAAPIAYFIVGANLTELELTIYDRDNKVISGGQIYLKNAITGYNQNQISSTNGKVRFSQVYNDPNWELIVNYTVGAGYSISTVYNIYHTMNYLIQPSNQEFIYSKSIFNCNLTTLDLYVIKFEDNSPLYAKIYIQNTTSSYNITEIQADASGYAKILLPASEYNVSIYYASEFQESVTNQTGDSTYAVNKTFSISSALNLKFSVSLPDLEIVKLTLEEDYAFAKPTWAHTVLATEISMYYGDVLALNLGYRKSLDNSLFNPSSNQYTGNWSLYSGLNWLNGSDPLPAGSFHDASYYVFYIKSEDYGVGTFALTIKKYGTPGSISDAEFRITIKIQSITTKLEQLTPQNELQKQWNQTMTIQINFTSVLPEVRNLHGLSISKVLNQGSIAENFVSVGITGLYELVFDTSQLSVGNYYLTVSAQPQNYTLATLTIFFVISELSTLKVNEISPLYKVATDSLQVALYENISVAFNYSYVFNLSAVEDAEFQAYIDSDISANRLEIYSPGMTSWQHMINVNATNFALGGHKIYILMSRINLQSQTMVLDLNIIDSWGTALEIITPPPFCNWGDNATFDVRYYIVESPRSIQNIDLTGAIVTQLNITFISNGQEISTRILLPNESQIWGVQELGVGNYRIWFNTSILEISNRSVFYAIPTIVRYNYDAATVKPYVWLDPLSTSVYLTSNDVPITYLDLYQNDQQSILAKLNVTEATSGILGQNIEGAQLLYYIKNQSSPFNLIATGEFVEIGNGEYTLQLVASLVGNFSLTVNMTHINHTLDTMVFIPIRVSLRPVSFIVAIDPNLRISSNSMKVAYGENITFQVTFLDIMAQYPSLDVSIGGKTMNAIYLGNGIYNCTDYATKFDLGQQQIIIRSILPGAKDSSQIIEINIMAVWKTQLEIIQPPTLYPWNDISTFIVRYSCIDDPRFNLPLANANITALNITFDLFGTEQLFRTLDSKTLNISWGWSDLKSVAGYGAGYYSVWMNTSIFTITKRSSYYIIPLINVSVYQQASARPYIWVAPVETSLAPFASVSQTQENNTYTLYLDQSQKIYVKYWVSDEGSVLENLTIVSGSVFCEIYNRTDTQDFIGTFILTDMNNGYYELNLAASILGNFEIVVYASKLNYTSVSTSIFFTVLKKPIITYISTQTYVIPHNRPFTMAISAQDLVHENALLDANVYLMIDNQKYTFTWNTSSQQYELEFTQALLDGFAEGTYNGSIYVEKDNYTTTPIPVALTIDLPVDPYLNLPYRYWMIIIVTVGVMIAAIVTQQAIKNARIPLILKQIDKTRKLIRGNKVVPDGNISLSPTDEIIELYANKWKALDLNLASLLKPSGKEPQEGAMTDSDQPENQAGGN